MSVRFTVAIDLSKFKHTASLFDTTTGEIAQSLDFKVNEAGFTQFDQLLHSFSSDPKDFIVGCEATGHYGETLLRHLQAQGYAVP